MKELILALTVNHPVGETQETLGCSSNHSYASFFALQTSRLDHDLMHESNPITRLMLRQLNCFLFRTREKSLYVLLKRFKLG